MLLKPEDFLYQTVYLDMKIVNIVKTLGNIVVVLKKTVLRFKR